jgi:hypothetical protein
MLPVELVVCMPPRELCVMIEGDGLTGDEKPHGGESERTHAEKNAAIITELAVVILLLLLFFWLFFFPAQRLGERVSVAGISCLPGSPDCCEKSVRAQGLD